MIKNLRDEHKPISRARAIELLANTPLNEGKAFLLVEGKRDEEVYCNFFSDAQCKITTTGGYIGMEVVFRILKESASFKPLLLAIRDMDFLKVEGKQLPKDMFWTDAHDLEMMSIESGNAVKELFVSLDTPYEKAVMDIIYEELKYVSYIKWYVWHNGLDYRVNDLNVAAKSEAEIGDLNLLIKEIQNKTPKRSGLSRDAVVEFIEKNKDCKRSEITNGHDFCSRLNYMFRQRRKQKSKKDIEAFIGSHFSFNSFTKTNLYKSIVDWEKRNGKVILRKEEGWNIISKKET